MGEHFKMRMTNWIKTAGLAGLIIGSAAFSCAQESAPDAMPPFTIIAPEFQNLQNSFTFGQTVYETKNYIPVTTTVTLDLEQDYRGKLVGKATVSADNILSSFDLNCNGQLRLKNGQVSFNLKGKSARDAATTAQLKMSAVLIAFQPANPDFISTKPLGLDDFKSTSTYAVHVDASGYDKGFHFDTQVSIFDVDFLSMRLAEPNEYQKKEKRGQHYYILSAPWGSSLASGMLAGNSLSDLLFSVKAKKFSFLGFGYDLDKELGSFNSVSGKVGYGKYSLSDFQQWPINILAYWILVPGN